MLCSCLLGPRVVAAPLRLEGLRLGAGPEHAVRAVLDLSGEVSFKLFTLADPNRIVIDLRRTRAGRLPAVPPPLPDPLLGVRVAPRNGSDLRVVLDLRRPVDPRGFLLAPDAERGHRLVVELPRAPGGKPAGSAAAPRESAARLVAVRTSAEPPRALAKAREGGAPTASTAGLASPDRLPGRDLIVAVDAGHGGKDPGAVGARGTKEKQVALAIAKRLAGLIRTEPGMRPVLIREDDRYLTLRGRILRARRLHADLFVSIHADAFRRRQARGASVFILSRRGASSEAARWLAARENALELVGGVSLGDRDPATAEVLLDLSQAATIELSWGVAKEVLEALGEVAALHDTAVGRAGFLVLKSPDIPSILVETGFLSNPDEERLLRSSAHRQRIATAILRGIRTYFTANPVSGTWLASRRHVIVRGDTLSGIAHKYSVSLEALRTWNGLESDLIRVGEVLRIPISKTEAARGRRG
jgi:N-acetylmuramoyl-L-alanine amidase